MNRYCVFILLFQSITCAASVNTHNSSAPELGNIHATAHQFCGEHITVQIAQSGDGYTLIGLNNKSSGRMDVFISDNPGEAGKSYSRFSPVTFDNLSGHFVKTDATDIDIVWGGAVDDKQAVKYQLALGNYTYQCDAMMAWPSDKANALYGEPLKEEAEEAVTAAPEKAPDNAAGTVPVKQNVAKAAKAKA